MNIEYIEVVKDDDISKEGTDFYTIYVNGEALLECVAYQDVGVAIGEFLKNPKQFEGAFM